jgi:hypothetical protein
MQPLTIGPRATSNDSELVGVIVTEEVRHNGRRLFQKGHRLAADDLATLAELVRPFHAVRLMDDDVHEDEAARRLAAVAMGPGLTARGPVQSRVNLVAARKGLLRVDPAAVLAINTLADTALFTLPDRLSVLPGKVVAGAKITPVAIPDRLLAQAEAYARARPRPIVEVAPFQPLVVGVVTTEGLTGRTRERFQATVRRKIGWFGGSVLRFEELPNDASAVARAIEGMITDGAQLVLTGGGNTIDPLDATLQALPMIGASVVRFGAPVHPGSMFWLAYAETAGRPDTPIFNLSSCSMYSKATVADLVLPWVMAGDRVTRADIAGIGYGGLLDRDMGWRFPPYDAESVDEPDEG